MTRADSSTDQNYQKLREAGVSDDASVNGYRFGKYLLREQAHVRGLIGDEPRPILDVGCGTGLLLAPLATASRVRVGIDFNEAACLDARRNDLQVVRGDAFQLPFRTGSFGAVVSTQFLNQQSPEAVRSFLSENWRVLSHSGRLILVWRNGHALIHRVAHGVYSILDRLKGRPQFPYFNHTSKEIREWAISTGFDIETEHSVLAVAGLKFENSEGLASKSLGASHVMIVRKR